MSAIVKSCGFGMPPGLSISGSESRQRSRAFWGDGIEDGMPIGDFRAVQKASAERMMNVIEADPRAAVMLTMIDVVDPNWIRKAVFDNTYGMEGFRADVKKSQQDLASELDAQLRGSTMKKATSTSTVSNLMHNYSDEQVVMLFKKIYPLQALIPVEANHGKVAQWDAITETGKGNAAFGSEDPTPAESDMIDALRTATCKIMYAFTRVTKMARIAGQTQYPARDLMAIRQLAANESIRDLRERSIIGVSRDLTNVDPTYTSASSLEYAGLYEMITNNTTASLTQTYSGGTATLDKIKPFLDETIRLMVRHGRYPNLIVADWKTFGVIGRGMNDFYRTEQIKSTELGFDKIDVVTPIGKVPMVPIQWMPTTTGNYGSMMVLDTSYLALRKLWGETFEELANLNGSQRGMISASEVLIDKTDKDGSSSQQGGVFGITIP
ncbi:MAG: DUF5309 family protein [Methanoregula sp.]